MIYRQSIQHRLVFYVSLGLLLFSLLGGGLTYRLAYDEELANAAAMEKQLVSTVQAQAEVAVFAANKTIADGVIEGLRAAPRILAVRIVGEGGEPFSVAAGASAGNAELTAADYPLFSPVDGAQRIGMLYVHRNDPLIRAEATMRALRQTAVMVLQMLAAAVLIILFSRQLIGKPVVQLADSLAAIKIGSGARLSISDVHAHDEIGSLADSANTLIAAAESALAEVQALATTDALTGLPNRRAFMARLEEELARIRRYALAPAGLLMLDLDHFKQVNDQHSHAAGDQVLRSFSTLLAAQLRAVDMAGRIGGEEFAVILPDTDVPAAATFAERLREAVANMEIAHEGKLLRVTVSIGIAGLSPADSRPEEALARADKALYQAKQGGRNRVELLAESV